MAQLQEEGGQDDSPNFISKKVRPAALAAWGSFDYPRSEGGTMNIDDNSL
ncbi:predicted protein [Chaetomium globosum CBS 148.51]|uniref:Uncharacterized protein n=1 Tax=Chaetomium globosum (strain ATCC 6205 / CBS 148.51 / DSM 1962 / NBRC 6347 / NRRL 1970) TaxID=306901 RepID=Q2GTX4_CHAGB|nr:uncharacterized protein CHGG_08580 [Chaetomium globosum CBS 148.51]EAQ84566.1 predicted protein [Chaetomium globosum CBS 148.51]